MFSEVAIRRFATLSPARYSGLYAAWNVDVDRDGRADDPWDFGTVTQYPVLKVNFDDQGTASWQEFGHQLRAGLSLTATTFNGKPVALSWTVVDTSCPDRIASTSVLQIVPLIIRRLDGPYSRPARGRICTPGCRK